eukprot:1492140-Karenia_brevis.AAC.1
MLACGNGGQWRRQTPSLRERKLLDVVSFREAISACENGQWECHCSIRSKKGLSRNVMSFSAAISAYKERLDSGSVWHHGSLR